MLVSVECLKIQSPLAKTKQLLFHTLFFLFFSFILFCNICRLSQSNCHVTENYICKRNNLEYHALCNYTSDTPVYLCSMEKHSYHFLQMIQSTMHNFLLHIISDTAGLGWYRMYQRLFEKEEENDLLSSVSALDWGTSFVGGWAAQKALKTVKYDKPDAKVMLKLSFECMIIIRQRVKQRLKKNQIHFGKWFFSTKSQNYETARKVLGRFFLFLWVL